MSSSSKIGRRLSARTRKFARQYLSCLYRVSLVGLPAYSGGFYDPHGGSKYRSQRIHDVRMLTEVLIHTQTIFTEKRSVGKMTHSSQSLYRLPNFWPQRSNLGQAPHKHICEDVSFTRINQHPRQNMAKCHTGSDLDLCRSIFVRLGPCSDLRQLSTA